MPAKRTGRIQKATAIVPLALLSAAWTASLAGVTPTSAVSASPSNEGGRLPDGGSVPSEAIEAPASVSEADSGSVTDGDLGDTEQIVSSSSTNGIPSSALAAYQRAETVINAADKSCNLTWQLVAAIGRVESDHGRFGGSALDSDGVAVPAIRGIALDGKNNTAVIRDTDAGQYDDDPIYDRAVGPMQFIPSTWSVVGVDADDDGVRNPQDIDDAALAAAVYLCSGNDDLSTLSGQKAAVYRYNHSGSYVDLVLSIMDNYLEGDFMSVPDSTVSAGYLTPTPTVTDPGPRGSTRGGGTQPSTGGEGATQAPPTGTEPTEEPGQPTEPENNGGGDEKPEKPKPLLPKPPLPTVSLPTLPQTSIKPVDDVLTLAQAIVQCTLNGLVDNPLTGGDRFDVCVKNYTTK